MSFMSQCYSVIIDFGISSPGHGKEVFDDLNAIYKQYIYISNNVQCLTNGIENIWLTDYNSFFQKKKDVSLDKQFQKHLSEEHCKHGIVGQGKCTKRDNKINGQTDSIMFRIMLMFYTKKSKYILIQTNFQHYHFVVCIQSLVTQGGWVIIIIYVLILK